MMTLVRMKRGSGLALAVERARVMVAGAIMMGVAAAGGAGAGWAAEGDAKPLHQGPLHQGPLHLTPLAAKAAEVERSLGARVGMAVLDTASGQIWEYRGNERFPLNSTFKALLCGALLHKAGRGEVDLRRQIPVEAGDLVSYSPVTEKRVGTTMTLTELCAAAMTYSDNAAANLVMRSAGGPSGLTAALRQMGDPVTRVDRWEPDMNEATPGDLRDTTTPLAVARTLHALALGPMLSAQYGDQFRQWLIDNQVSGPVLRAGIPAGWQVGDRTGAGGYGSRSVIAVVWPPQRKPLIVAAYLTETKATLDQRNAALAALGQTLAGLLPASP